jgi:hypothetical protein
MFTPEYHFPGSELIPGPSEHAPSRIGKTTLSGQNTEPTFSKRFVNIKIFLRYFQRELPFFVIGSFRVLAIQNTPLHGRPNPSLKEEVRKAWLCHSYMHH